MRILTGLLLCLLSVNGTASELKGNVVGVSDGDTLTMLLQDKRQVKVRLAQIDAPEKKQAFGEAAKQSLSDLVFKKIITVNYADADRYGRVVGQVVVNNTDVNLEQIKRGMAWVYRQYAKDQSYYAAEEVAKNQRIGIWSQPDVIPPWEFRKNPAQPKPAPALPVAPAPAAPKAPLLPPAKTQDSATYKCGSKRFCKQMTSCDEAKFYLNQCGIDKLDGNHDGVPCESLCSQ